MKSAQEGVRKGSFSCLLAENENYCTIVITSRECPRDGGGYARVSGVRQGFCS